MRGIALVTYNRDFNLEDAIYSICQTAPSDCRIVVCDDGSTDRTFNVVTEFDNIVYIRGSNAGVAFNKNRALFALQDCEYICILEDDLIPTQIGWFQEYERISKEYDIQHFCRVQDKRLGIDHNDLKFGISPRGDFTFITNNILKKVGGFNTKFKGIGYAHGEWSRRAMKAGAVSSIWKDTPWIDIKKDYFKQLNDTKGGRWSLPAQETQRQLTENKKVLNSLTEYLWHPLTLE